MYINQITIPDIGVEEVIPITLTFEEIPVQSGNTVDECKRFDLSDSTDTGTDISDNASVVTGTNQMLITNIWLDADTPAAGKYRIQARMKDNTGTVIEQEANLIVKVHA